MRAIKRHFFELDAHLVFGEAQGYSIEKYFDKAMYPSLNDPFVLYIDFTHFPAPTQVTITLTYLDSSKKSHPQEKLEYIIHHSLSLIRNNKPGKKQIPIPIVIKEGSKELWKIKFEVKDKKNTILNLSA
ncbi:MAG: hypothetical protein ABUL44_04100 [Flavobacterium sp.]